MHRWSVLRVWPGLSWRFSVVLLLMMLWSLHHYWFLIYLCIAYILKHVHRIFLLTVLRRWFWCCSIFLWFEPQPCIYTKTCSKPGRIFLLTVLRRWFWCCSIFLCCGSVGFVLSSIVITSLGTRELVAMLSICPCVHILWFHGLLLFLLVPEKGCGLWLLQSQEVFSLFSVILDKRSKLIIHNRNLALVSKGLLGGGLKRFRGHSTLATASVVVHRTCNWSAWVEDMKHDRKHINQEPTPQHN